MTDMTATGLELLPVPVARIGRGRMVNMTKPLPQLGMPIPHMLMDAISRHCMQHYGEKPKRFEMHPAVYAEFMRNLEPWMYVILDREPPTFQGVEIVADRLATRPKMITADNMVEYL